MNNSKLIIDDIYPIMIEGLDDGKKIEFSPKGSSMLPLIKSGDIVILEKSDKYKKNDIVFYSIVDKKYVLHRIRKIRNNRCYIKGDNPNSIKEWVDMDRIIALMVERIRNDKHLKTDSLNFKVKSFFILLLKPFRIINNKFKRLIKKIFNK